ncbi:hypothetical protein LOTGIDRAFT_218637 [Lottia gigantea]|uniref:galactosylceramidase n=1 Tax=Lottia gigantea TaxID=225164 RepID=V3ZZF2_LOTGI|nr:hypothetical protein LOTGIDRAFT_218637 [Lottia gigantea]ESO89802.1 hypothetical protein LOTGIDRAFT_218637 [Lottia gigantea]
MKMMMSSMESCIVLICMLCCFIEAAEYTFDDSVGLGRQFDGIGGLSGGGATSKLLVNYPEEQRNQILDYLFKPNFGASLHILKVEIGGDAQSTDGTEASHMHNSWEENYERGYEWWLMVEAKKRNPNIKLYGLPWGFPGWIGAGTRSPYTNPTQTATYIIKWIQGAKEYYNLTIDYIGIWNERPYDVNYIVILRNMLDTAGLNHVRIVASDSGWGIATDILKNATLSSSVDYIGCHYPGTNSDQYSVQTGKQLWASEDYSTFNDNVGGGCWARILNQNYVNGYMTSTISWNLIASYYNNLPFYRDGLMTAVEPWSGNYIIESPIWLAAHTTQFTEIGWKYLRHGAGVGKLDDGGSYVALISPDNKDLTIIIETFSHDHSLCIRPALPKYTVKDQQVTINLKGNFANIKELQVWYSKPSYDNSTSTFFIQQKPLMVENGEATLTVHVDEIYTLTTLKTGSKGDYPASPSSQPFPLPYSDDFESYNWHQEPNNLAQQTGSYEVFNANDSTHGQIIRQLVLDQPVYWCGAEKLNRSLSVIGDPEWSDIYIEAETHIGDVNNTDGVFIAARIRNGGCQTFEADGIFFFVYPASNKIVLSRDLGTF